MSYADGMRRFLYMLLLVSFGCYAQLHTESNAPNADVTLNKPYVVLVSLDGFRYDYPQRYGAPHLMALAKRGVWAKNGMQPSYPSKTFPNHYTLVTGLLPEHHGIVENVFYAPDLDKEYNYKKNSQDGSFYDGVPLWSLAEQQGMRAATFFWPGSEAEIAGKRPSYWMSFDDKFDEHKRIDQVIAWLKLPERERPHLVHLYLSNVDHAGHMYGPDAPQTRDAVHVLDNLVGDLDTRLRHLKLPINLVVVADHGMMAMREPWINLDEIPWLAPLLKGVRHSGEMFYADDAHAQAIVDASHAHPDPRFTFYRRKDLPPSLHYDASIRIGDPVIVDSPGYCVRYSAGPSRVLAGSHGYDPAIEPQMKALFLAAGSGIKKKKELPVFLNVDVYDFVTSLLQIEPAANDGSLIPFKEALKN